MQMQKEYAQCINIYHIISPIPLMNKLYSSTTPFFKYQSKI